MILRKCINHNRITDTPDRKNILDQGRFKASAVRWNKNKKKPRGKNNE